MPDRDNRPTRPRTPDAPIPDAPVTDAQVLHAPWRLSYMQLLDAQSKATGGAEPDPKQAATFLRAYYLDPAGDEANHVIVRTGSPDVPAHDDASARGGLIMLNKYPYANGHLLVCLGEPRMRLLDYPPALRAELWSLVDLAVELCERALEPQGVNVGLNQGSAAGAGVPEHLHVHVVPRWAGDVNFMTSVAQVRVCPSSLDDVAKRYREVWGGVSASSS